MKAMMKKQALASAVMISAMPLSAFALDFSSTGVDIRDA